MAAIACIRTILLTGSCKKLIEIPPAANVISEEVVFTDSISIMGAIAGVYDGYGVATGSTTIFNGTLNVTTGLTGDELVTQATDLTYFNNAVLPSDGRLNSMWANTYNFIYRTNACMEGLATTNIISTRLRDQLIGELKFNRAIAYFYLINTFGDVPIILDTDFRKNAIIPRAPVDEVYNQILKDLTDAQKILVAKYPSADRARPNLYAVNAMLAKVYLYLGQWRNAEIAANSVIGSGLYTIVQNLANTFLYQSPEAIWQLPANGTGRQTADAQNFVPRSLIAPTTVPTYTISNYLLSSFEIGDLRKQQWIGVTRVPAVTGVDYTYPNKYKNRLATAPIEGYMMLRLSEIYLIRAEALARQNNTAAAIADLDMVRYPARVGVAKYSGPTDQTSVLGAIANERQVELFCESANRWFDLKRTGTINEVLGARKPNWKPNSVLFPIPLPQILSNPFLTQNP